MEMMSGKTNDLITISRQVIKELMLKYGFTASDMTVTEFVEDILLSAEHEHPDINVWNMRGEQE